ncbi:ribosomal protein L17 [Colletotrichum plurivorum]|uniref:Ribosomal protein L17 n=1 Tax=Colletotrichum plurivorum TaxID=2175906 RepID=A0A8H6NNE0_9PEZI|nr:ribosomal protein L17 [Colletotrichum plurivorum]
MAGGLVKYRHLSRNSAARKALLRGLVTQLIEHENIQTTYAKAKEAQRLAEKLITYAKRDNEETRRKAQAVLYEPFKHFPKLFDELKKRYASRPGGYTRVLRTEPKNSYDQADSAILELVDGKKDTRFAMTAKIVARDRLEGRPSNEITLKNVEKVTRYSGKVKFGNMVDRFYGLLKKEERQQKADIEGRHERAAERKKKEKAQEDDVD